MRCSPVCFHSGCIMNAAMRRLETSKMIRPCAACEYGYDVVPLAADVLHDSRFQLPSRFANGSGAASLPLMPIPCLRRCPLCRQLILPGFRRRMAGFLLSASSGVDSPVFDLILSYVRFYREASPWRVPLAHPAP